MFLFKRPRDNGYIDGQSAYIEIHCADGGLGYIAHIDDFVAKLLRNVLFRRLKKEEVCSR